MRKVPSEGNLWFIFVLHKPLCSGGWDTSEVVVPSYFQLRRLHCGLGECVCISLFKRTKIFFEPGYSILDGVFRLEIVKSSVLLFYKILEYL